ncbi:arylacetamide deacetylase-like 4 [Mixophyes fleayi]|uniref:arylacetamide deacetylase-like 4 n=1 Tax=Mixophyes fleayi TaxID=3061075 RepID=UPI003F4E07EC
MCEGLATLGALIAVFLLFSVLLFAGVTYYECSKADIPPGVANPTDLWRIHGITAAFSILGKTLEKLGICSEIACFQFAMRFAKPKFEEDPELFMKNLQFEGVPVRVYQPRAPSVGDRKGIMYFHGGGFVFGSIDTYDVLCRYIAKKSGAVVVSVGYRLAPEHKYPAAFDDCLGATIHFLKKAAEHGVDSSSIIICGDSAGGNLTAAVCQALVTRTDLPKPLAQVLIYPVVQMVDYNLPSYQQNSMVPLLLRERTLFYKLHYVGSNLSEDLCKEILDGRHVPPQMRMKFSKWLNVDNIPEEFKAKGYKPHTAASFNSDLYEKIKRVFEPHFSPLLAEDSVIGLLPKAYLLTCEFDVLRDEELLYKRRLEENGVPVTWYHVKDGFHGIVSFFDKPNVTSGKMAVDNVVTFIKNL